MPKNKIIEDYLIRKLNPRKMDEGGLVDPNEPPEDFQPGITDILKASAPSQIGPAIASAIPLLNLTKAGNAGAMTDQIGSEQNQALQEAGMNPSPTEVVNKYLTSNPNMDQGQSALDSKTVSSNPGHNPEEQKIASNPAYMTPSEMVGEVNKFGPEQEATVLDYLTQGFKSPGNLVSQGAAGIGDAITNAFGGHQQALGNILQQKQATMEQAERVLPEMQKGELAKVEGQEKVQELDPNSPASKVAQQTFGPIFQKMGYSQKAVSGMSASQIKDAANAGLTFADTQAKLELQKAMQTYDAQLKNLGISTGAAEALSKQGLWGRLTTPSAVEKQLVNTATGGAGAEQTGMLKIRASDGSLHMLPSQSLGKAKQRDPGLQVIQ